MVPFPAFLSSHCHISRERLVFSHHLSILRSSFTVEDLALSPSYICSPQRGRIGRHYLSMSQCVKVIIPLWYPLLAFSFFHRPAPHNIFFFLLGSHQDKSCPCFQKNREFPATAWYKVGGDTISEGCNWKPHSFTQATFSKLALMSLKLTD